MNDRALKILEQYDLEILSTRRGRGSYICETPQGLRILCDYTGSENKALFQNCIMEKIREGGYEKVDKILPNREGALISRDWEQNKYVVKEWYVGRECDTSNENEILAAVTNLARLHRLMQLGEDCEFRKNFTATAPTEEIRAQNAELRKIRTFIRKKNAKQDFERLFLNYFSQYYEQAAEAEQKADALSEYGNAALQKYPGVCHGDYNHHHVLMSGYDIATTNFECCRFDYQINDLYRFMRKILEKHDWNQRLGMRMLEYYAQVRPIPRQERQLLYIRMLYPEKFRKLANHYYGSNKAWVSGRFLEKLENLNRQEEQKNKFVRLLEK
ncbi:MAG: CotS family spore coat protein [Lachnospiraceae bacterium]|jgi:CotS family spore coat protein|nr:CotS family spore coat protein [Lachnospiraceae bacterium]RKJ49370.1 CotS family spore coat protein [bacterium 1XD42-54]